MLIPISRARVPAPPRARARRGPRRAARGPRSSAWSTSSRQGRRVDGALRGGARDRRRPPGQVELAGIDDELLREDRDGDAARTAARSARSIRRTTAARRAPRSRPRRRAGRPGPGRRCPRHDWRSRPADGDDRLISAITWRPGAARRSAMGGMGRRGDAAVATPLGRRRRARPGRRPAGGPRSRRPPRPAARARGVVPRCS